MKQQQKSCNPSTTEEIRTMRGTNMAAGKVSGHDTLEIGDNYFNQYGRITAAVGNVF